MIITNGDIVNFVAERGANFIREIEYRVSVSTTPITLTGYSITLSVYRVYPQTFLRATYTVGPYMTASTNNALITISGTKMTVSIASATIDALASGVYDYHLDIISPSAVTTRVSYGLFDVVDDITT